MATAVWLQSIRRVRLTVRFAVGASMLATLLLARTSTPAAADSPGQIQSRLAAIGSSAAGVQARTLASNVMTDPAVRDLVTRMLAAQGQPGTTLTAFQYDLLRDVLVITQDPVLLKAIILGTPLTSDQRSKLSYLRAYLSADPAMQAIARAASKLQQPANAGTLTADINTVASIDATPVSDPGPSGDASLDAISKDILALKQSSSTASVAQQTIAVARTPGFQSFLQQQPPALAGTLLPISQVLALTLNNEADPPLVDIFKAGLEILGGLAAIGAAILLLPEVLTGAIIAGTILAIIAGLSAYIIGLIDLVNALDCDHDGDPGDPDEGSEC